MGTDEGSLEAAMWTMVIVQTIGNIDLPGKGPRKLPPPRAYVAVIVGFSLLQLLADAGLGKAAKIMGWTTVLAAAALGPFGTRFIGFLNAVSAQFATPAQSNPTPTP